MATIALVDDDRDSQITRRLSPHHRSIWRSDQVDEAMPRVDERSPAVQGVTPAALMTDAKRLARKAIKAQWQAQGRKVPWGYPHEVAEATRVYLDTHRAQLVSPEFERELIRARTDKGRKRAKARGVRFGRKLKLTAHQRAEALVRRAAGDYGHDGSTEQRVHDKIDAACRRRTGMVSRNTWITEAILEKLDRELPAKGTTQKIKRVD